MNALNARNVRGNGLFSTLHTTKNCLMGLGVSLGIAIALPNSEVWGSRIENLLPGEHRLIEFLFILSSNDDARRIKEAWEKAVEAHPGIDKEKWSMSIPYISPSSGSLIPDFSQINLKAQSRDEK